MQNLISRRKLVGLSIGAQFFGMGASSSSIAFSRDTLAVDDVFEVSAPRPFTSEGAHRFLVEVHNITDSIVDAPALGLLLMNQPKEADFVFAAPAHTIIHPHSSSILYGVTPSDDFSDPHWVDAEWSWCDDLQTSYSEKSAELQIELEYEEEVVSDLVLHINFRLRNVSENDSGPFEVGGSVFDGEGNAAGVTLPWPFQTLRSKQVLEERVTIARGQPYFASPFAFVENVLDIKVELNIFPQSHPSGYACPAVMPWNR